MPESTPDARSVENYDQPANDGEFVRKDSQFRNWVTVDGRPGPSGEGEFPAERGRYHLYVSYACPWAHRTLILRKMKRLENVVPVSVVHPDMPEESWKFGDYPNLGNYTRDLYQQPGIADTVNLDHIKRHYYYSHVSINPTRIVPKGPAVDYSQPHNRDRFG